LALALVFVCLLPYLKLQSFFAGCLCQSFYSAMKQFRSAVKSNFFDILFSCLFSNFSSNKCSSLGHRTLGLFVADSSRIDNRFVIHIVNNLRTYMHVADINAQSRPISAGRDTFPNTTASRRDSLLFVS